MAALNAAWQAASQDMYAGAQGGAEQNGATDNHSENQNANNTEDVQDAEVVEEVK
ncbi:MAG: hypothetical protein IPF58_17255 [Saprospirales bacterium]|nr:hypothetical protein [Saprospirales bacterium]